MTTEMKYQYLCKARDGELFITTEKCKNKEDAQQYVGDGEVIRPISDTLTSYEAELENTVKCLMGYVMELHDFQMGARKIIYEDEKYVNDEKLRDFIVMKFPMLQGSRNHQTFRDLGEDANWNDVGSVVKILRDKASKTD